MESSWAFAKFLWGALIAGIVILFAHEMRKSPEQKKREAELARERYEERRLAERIVDVKSLGISGFKFKRGGLRGALFGGFIGGVPGAAVGAMLPAGKGVPVESFAVKYGNGKVIIRECMQGSSEYKALMKYVEK